MLKQKNYQLLVMAHPDDESIFCSGLLQKEKNWLVICATDADADGQGGSRMLQWRAALKALGIKNQIGWNLPDIFEKRLPIDFMVDQLLALPTPKAVYTHSIIGDYGHPHHQDVSMAVHHAFYKKAPVWSLAYNCAPDKTLVLTKKHFEKKTKILSEIYFSETQRFSHFLPAHYQENFAKLSYEEVKEIYSYFLRGEKIDSKKIKKYRWYLPYLAHLRAKLQARPF